MNSRPFFVPNDMGNLLYVPNSKRGGNEEKNNEVNNDNEIRVKFMPHMIKP